MLAKASIRSRTDRCSKTRVMKKIKCKICQHGKIAAMLKITFKRQCLLTKPNIKDSLPLSRSEQCTVRTSISSCSQSWSTVQTSEFRKTCCQDPITPLRNSNFNPTRLKHSRGTKTATKQMFWTSTNRQIAAFPKCMSLRSSKIPLRNSTLRSLAEVRPKIITSRFLTGGFILKLTFLLYMTEMKLISSVQTIIMPSIILLLAVLYRSQPTRILRLKSHPSKQMAGHSTKAMASKGKWTINSEIHRQRNIMKLTSSRPSLLCNHSLISNG